MDILTVRLNTATTARREFVRGLNAFQPVEGITVLAILAALIVPGCNKVEAQGNSARGENAPAQDNGDPSTDETKIGVTTIDVNQRAHLLSLVNDGNDTFVLATIPAADAQDQSITTRTVLSEDGLSSYHVCGVYGGHLLALKPPIEFVAIDLATGVRKQITQAWCENAILAGHHLFFVVGTGFSTESGKLSHALHVMDLQTGNQRELCQISGARSAMQSGHDFSLAATADGALIAVTEMIPAADQLSMQTSCRIVVVDVRTGEVTRSQPDFAGRRFMTGAGDHLLAPKIIWIDNESLLIVASVAAKSPEGFSRAVVIELGLKMFQYRPKTQATELICPLPNNSGQMHDPWFSRERESQIVIHLGSRGPFAVDLKKEELVEHDVVIGDYVLEQAGGLISLRYGENVLAPETEQSRVFASPDGQRMAWLPVAARGGFNITEPVELKMHDRVRGVRSVLTKRFPPKYFSPATNVCLWLTDADLNRTDVFDQMMVIENLPEPPHVDSRPAAKDSVEVSLKTDKGRYWLHEPIELTITIRNLSETPIRFESRLLKQGAQPFNALYLASPNAEVQIHIYEQHMLESPGEFVEILPGQSRVFTRTVESGDLGKHNFRMRFEQYSAWKGFLNAAAQFEVVAGGNEAELLRKKFDRMVAKCLAEFTFEPTSVRYDQFEQLGPAGSRLLVEFLQNCEDGRFRQQLGRGLQRIADETTLPYVKELLKTDLQFDADTVVGTLWAIYRRGDYRSLPVPETTALLIEAGQHRNVEVRRKAVTTLCHSVNDAVDQFMQRAAEDSDATVAQTAARYVAARQQLPLHLWLHGASRKITPAGLVAARSVIRELEQSWQEKRGEIPDGTFAEVTADPAKVAEYSATLKEWVSWCLVHQRSIETFFDKDREANTAWQGFGINRYASGSNEPIVLKPRVTHLIKD